MKWSIEGINLILQFSLVLVAVIGLVFAIIELRQIKISRKRQFDQSRREKTAEMVIYYTKQISNETKYIEKIVSSLSDEQCIDLYNCTPFVIDDKTKEKLCSICPYKSKCAGSESQEICKGEDGHYYIRDELLYYLRGDVISYLNTLESVLLTWQLGIVEQSVIEEQFAFLNKKRQKERALETFRTIAGNGKSYPAIEKFYQHLDKSAAKEAEDSLKDILQ